MNSVFLKRLINSDNITYTPKTSLGEIPLLDAMNEGFAIYQKLEKEELHFMGNRHDGFDYIDTFFVTKPIYIEEEKISPQVIRIRNYRDTNNITGDEDGYTCQIHDITKYIDSDMTNSSKSYLFYSLSASISVDNQYFLGDLEYDIIDVDDDRILDESSYNKLVEIPGMVIGHIPFFGQIVK